MTTKKPKIDFEAKPVKIRENNILESLERLSKRPESRVDVQRLLDGLSPNGKIYARHLVVSGPSSIVSAAKACSLTQEEIALAIEELERGVAKLRR